MSVLLAILGIVGAIVLLVVRSLAVDEVKGRLQRRITASVEATIAALPEELQAEWADEWRAELAAVISMPLTAAQFARGVRTSAQQLIGSQAPAPAGIDNHASAVRRSAHSRPIRRSGAARRGGWRLDLPRDLRAARRGSWRLALRSDLRAALRALPALLGSLRAALRALPALLGALRALPGALDALRDVARDIALYLDCFRDNVRARPIVGAFIAAPVLVTWGSVVVSDGHVGGALLGSALAALAGGAGIFVLINRRR